MNVLTTDNISNTFNSVAYSFNTTPKAIQLSGDSATGKTLLFTIFQKHISRVYPVIAIDSANQFKHTNIEDDSSFIVIDRFDVWGDKYMRKRIDKAIGNSDNKFIIISRYFGFSVREEDRKELIYKDNVLQFK